MISLKEYEEKKAGVFLGIEGGLTYTEKNKEKNITEIFKIKTREQYTIHRGKLASLLPTKMMGEDILNLLYNENLTLKKRIQKHILYTNSICKEDLARPFDIHSLYRYFVDTTMNLGYKFDEIILNKYIKDFGTKQINDINNSLERPNSFFNKVIQNSDIKKEDLYAILKKSIEETIRILSSENLADYENFYCDEHKKYLAELKQIILARQDYIEIFNGGPGCGKSSFVANKIANQHKHDKCLVVTLSNMIGAEFVRKVHDKDKSINIEHFSNTKASLSLYRLNNRNKLKVRDVKSNDKKDNEISKTLARICNNDVIVIDEASQLGLYELKLILDLFKENPKAIFYFMTDLQQINSFLSGGSIIYSIMKLIPSRVNIDKDFDVNYRIADKNLWKRIKNINKGIFDFDIHSIKDIDFTNVDVIITGANKNVSMCNNLMYFYKHVKKGDLQEFLKENNDKQTDTLYDKLDKFKRLINNIKKYDTIPLICKQNTTTTFNNERFTLTKIDVDEVVVKSNFNSQEMSFDLSDRKKLIELYEMFDFCYAITVNRSQGLEWDSVVMLITRADRNLLNRNAIYVAMSRAKESVFVVSQTLLKDTSEALLRAEIEAFTNVKYEYVDLFDEDYVYKYQEKVYFAKIACIKSRKGVSKNGFKYELFTFVFAYVNNDKVFYVESDAVFASEFNKIVKRLDIDKNQYFGIVIKNDYIYNTKKVFIKDESQIKSISKSSNSENIINNYEHHFDNVLVVPHEFSTKMGSRIFADRVIYNDRFEGV